MNHHWQHGLTSIALISVWLVLCPHSIRAQQDCAALRARLDKSERDREEIRVELRKGGFAITIADWLPEQNAQTAAAMTVEVVTSLDSLDKLIADAGRSDGIDEINSLAESLYDPVLRRWTAQQARSLLGLSAERRQAVKQAVELLRQLSQRSVETREQLLQVGEDAAHRRRRSRRSIRISQQPRGRSRTAIHPARLSR